MQQRCGETDGATATAPQGTYEWSGERKLRQPVRFDPFYASCESCNCRLSVHAARPKNCCRPVVVRERVCVYARRNVAAAAAMTTLHGRGHTRTPNSLQRLLSAHAPAFSGPGRNVLPAWRHERAPSARLATGRNRFHGTSAVEGVGPRRAGRGCGGGGAGSGDGRGRRRRRVGGGGGGGGDSDVRNDFAQCRPRARRKNITHTRYPVEYIIIL